MRVQQIIQGLGGADAVAKALGITRPAVERWVRENLIPIHRQSEVLHLAVILGFSLTIKDLMAVTRTKKSEPAPEIRPCYRATPDTNDPTF